MGAGARRRWRWMSQQGWWTVRNTTPLKLRAALEVELEACTSAHTGRDARLD